MGGVQLNGISTVVDRRVEYRAFVNASVLAWAESSEYRPGH